MRSVCAAFVASFLAVVSLDQPALADVVFDQASLTSVTFAGAFNDNSLDDDGIDDAADASSLPLVPIVAETGYTGTVFAATSSMSNRVSATFASASSGAFEIGGSVSMISLADYSGTFAANLAGTYNGLTYRFTTSTNSDFLFRLANQATGNADHYPTYSVSLASADDPGNPVFLRNFRQGDFGDSVALTAGSYALSFFDTGYELTITGPGEQSADYSAALTFDITPAVLEPGSWAIMVGGIVLLGATLRRQQFRKLRFA